MAALGRPLQRGVIFALSALVNYKASANRIALRTCSNFSGKSVVIRAPSFPFDTVWRWSKLIAQSLYAVMPGENNLLYGLTGNSAAAISRRLQGLLGSPSN